MVGCCRNWFKVAACSDRDESSVAAEQGAECGARIGLCRHVECGDADI